MEFLVQILLLLVFSLILGRLFERLHMQAVVGQILAGVVIGPLVLGALAPSISLSDIAEVALFFILLQIGIEVTTELFTKDLRASVYLTFSSFIIPISIMFAIGVLLFRIPAVMALIAAIGIGVPSISIISVIIMQNKLLRFNDGAIIMASVVITDIIAFVILASSIKGSSYIISTTLAVLAFIVAFYVVDVALRLKAKPIAKFFEAIRKTASGEQIAFSIIILIGLAMSAIMQFIGLTYVLGAFFAGMLIHKGITGNRLYSMLTNTFRRINESFFIPLFFSIAGLQAIMPSGNMLVYFLALVLVSALIGGLLDYMASKRTTRSISPRNSLAILGSRGAVGVIIGK